MSNLDTFYKIPILELSNYYINRKGEVLDSNSNLKLKINNEEKILYYEFPNNTKVSIGKLLLITFTGNIDLPIKNKFGTNYDWYDGFEYIIPNNTKKNNNIITIKDKEFKQLYDLEVYVSKDGIIYNSYTNKFFMKYINEKGYYVMRIPKRYYEKLSSYPSLRKLMRINRLVWLTWNGNIPEGYEINHIDSNRWNNDLSNLECITKKENLIDGFSKNNYKFLTEEKVIEILKLYYSGEKIIDISKKLLLPSKNIQYITSGKTWKSIHKKFLQDKLMCSSTNETNLYK